MDVLVFLAQHPGEVLCKDEIIAAVWERQFLAESVLTRTITELRHALGDDPARPRYIETITKRGYRLVAPVSDMPSIRPPAAARGRGSVVVSYAGVRVALPEGETVIGRAPDADIRIDAMAVSRQHARIVVAAGRAAIEDLGSKNGTRIDGEPVEGPAELTAGSRIEIGPAVLLVHVVPLVESTETDQGRGAAAPAQEPSKGAG